MSCNDVIKIRHRSSCATLDCLISEIAVTSVSIALAKSFDAASCTALAIAELETVRFRAIISSNSASLSPAAPPPGGGYPGTPPPGGKKAGFTCGAGFEATTGIILDVGGGPDIIGGGAPRGGGRGNVDVLGGGAEWW